MAERLALQPNLSALKGFLPSIDYANFPFVCMNKDGIIVVVYQRSRQIYSVVGLFTSERSGEEEEHRQSAVEWGSVQLIGDGCNVQAAINNDGEVVIVYSNYWWRVCHYKAGVVQRDARQINWLDNAAGRLVRGVNPTVAMRGRTILFVYETDYGAYHVFYKVGEMRENRIWFTPEQRLRAFDECKQMTVAINTNGQVIFTCRSILSYYLYYSLGKLVGTELQNVTAPQRYGCGYFNHISLSDNGSIIAVHESWKGNQVMLRSGKIQRQDQDPVIWNEEQSLDTGYRISAAVNVHHQMIAVIVQSNRLGFGEGVLMYEFGSI